MKLREAIRVAEMFLGEYNAYDPAIPSQKTLWAFRLLTDHAEATRWRKLREEKPPADERYYDVWSSWSNAGEGALWDFDEDLQEWGFHQKFGWSHWRPQVGPED